MTTRHPSGKLKQCIAHLLSDIITSHLYHEKIDASTIHSITKSVVIIACNKKVDYQERISVLSRTEKLTKMEFDCENLQKRN